MPDSWQETQYKPSKFLFHANHPYRGWQENRKRAGKTKMNWLKRIIEDFRAGTFEELSGIQHITIYHDDDCQYLKGTGVCNCEAEVKLENVH